MSEWPHLVSAREVGTTHDHRKIMRAKDAKGSLHLFVPVNEPNFEKDNRSIGVILLPQRMSVGGQNVNCADLVCHEPRLFHVFEHLLEDATDRLSRETESSVEIIRNTLSEWRELLRRSCGGVDENVLIGLRGELEILTEMVTLVGPEALENWVGPLKRPRDFQNSRAALEVKTTTSQSSQEVNVHGLRQLTPMHDIELAIFLVRLEFNEQSPSVNQLLALLKRYGVHEEALEDKMVLCGWKKHQDDWDRGFSVLEISSWQVNESFPGLREDRMEPLALKGLTAMTYSLNLGACGPAMTSREREEFLRKAGAR